MRNLGALDEALRLELVDAGGILAVLEAMLLYPSIPALQVCGLLSNAAVPHQYLLFLEQRYSTPATLNTHTLSRSLARSLSLSLSLTHTHFNACTSNAPSCYTPQYLLCSWKAAEP
jgi:hypothetical protein